MPFGHNWPEAQTQASVNTLNSSVEATARTGTRLLLPLLQSARNTINLIRQINIAKGISRGLTLDASFALARPSDFRTLSACCKLPCFWNPSRMHTVAMSETHRVTYVCVVWNTQSNILLCCLKHSDTLLWQLKLVKDTVIHYSDNQNTPWHTVVMSETHSDTLLWCLKHTVTHSCDVWNTQWHTVVMSETQCQWHTVVMSETHIDTQLWCLKHTVTHSGDVWNTQVWCLKHTVVMS